MENTSGLAPRGRAVLIQPYEPEKKKSLIELPPDVAGRSVMMEQRAIVVAVGNEAWADESEPRAKPGDKVFVTKFAGMMVQGTLDGEQYRLVNDRDIFCKIVKEKGDE